MRQFILIALFISTLFSASNVEQGELQYLRVTKDTLSPEQVYAHYYSDKFTKIEKQRKFGFTKDTFWFAFKYKSDEEYKNGLVFNFLFPLLDFIDIYEVIDNQMVLKEKFGDRRKYNNDSLTYTPIFQFYPQKDESKLFFIKVSSISINISYEICEYNEYLERSLMDNKVMGIFIGAIVAMILYNFIVYLFIQNKNYIYYTVFHVCYLFYLLSLSGYAFKEFWPEYPDMNIFFYPIIMSLTLLFALLFLANFLETKTTIPRLHNIVRFFIFMNFTSLVLAISNHENFVVQYTVSVSMISVVVMLAIAMYSFITKKSKNAIYYVFSWTFLLIGAIITYLTLIMGIEENSFTRYSSQIGTVMEVLLLSIGLAAYYNRIQREKNMLAAENMYLYDISNKDPLTGLYNRRYFFDRADSIIQTQKPSSLLMLDLDHFKQINDSHGHSIGDEVLKAFADTMKKLLRKTDTIARYGGEEFVVILPNCQESEAQKIAELINQQTRDIQLESLPDLKLSVSIGLLSDVNEEIDKALHKADEALYTAKTTGRDTFVQYQ